jgi:hypothetical protein
MVLLESFTRAQPPREFLPCFEMKGDTFLALIITADETRFQRYEPETKRQPVEWHHQEQKIRKVFVGDEGDDCCLLGF